MTPQGTAGHRSTGSKGVGHCLAEMPSSTTMPETLLTIVATLPCRIMSCSIRRV